jgi:hypothetical protein
MKEVTIGNQYGKLTVIAHGQRIVMKHGTTQAFVCECFCGKVVLVAKSNLVSGNSKTCGCQRMANMKAATTTHNLSKSVESNTWRKIKDKCYNPKNPDYRYYGGRGIVMDETWRNSFEAFYEGIGPRPTPKHTLDRIDVNGNYEPGNVRWATRQVQSLNRRTHEMSGIYFIRGKYRILCRDRWRSASTIEEAKKIRAEDWSKRMEVALIENELAKRTPTELFE